MSAVLIANVEKCNSGTRMAAISTQRMKSMRHGVASDHLQVTLFLQSGWRGRDWLKWLPVSAGP